MAIFKCIIQYVNYMHIVIPQVSRMFYFAKLKLYTHWTTNRLHLPPIPGNHRSSLYLRVWLLVVWSLSCVQLFATPWITAHQAPLSSTIFQSLLKFMSIELVMLFNHLTLCHMLLLPSAFLSIRVFCNELALCFRWPKYWSFSFIISPSIRLH